MSTRPILSLVTGTMNRKDSFFRLLESIEKHTLMPWEMIVSDASDTCYSLNCHRKVRTIVERERLGCTKAYNRAFAQAQGQYVIWLNDDAEVMEGYAEKAVTFMEQNPNIGMGCLYYAEEKPPFKVNEYWHMVYANFGIISRELGDRVGWFDEIVTMYGCDNSLTFRVLLAGRGVASVPGAMVWHHRVLDEAKIENQKLREPDAQKLKEKYAPLWDQMFKAYYPTRHMTRPLVLGE